MRLETLAVHAGRRVDPTTGAVTPAIHPSTTFEREPDGSYPRGFLYARNANPNRNALEECLAALEGGEAAAAFASASAATSAVFLALQPGDHVVAPTDAYHGTSRLLRETFSRWGLEATFVDMTDVAAVRRAIRPSTRLVWVETPSNPLWKVTDIAAIGALARAASARYVCDNTTATPVLQSPFRLGADLIVHATTKFLGGHGDVIGGAVVTKTRDPFFEKVRAIQASGGAVPSPFDCWLVLRGIRTLPSRMRAHSENALRVATFLAGHARVEAVHYPGLPSHPGHDIARGQRACLHAGDELRRNREPRRASRLDRGARDTHTREPAAPQHRTRERRRPDRGPRSGARVREGTPMKLHGRAALVTGAARGIGL